MIFEIHIQSMGISKNQKTKTSPHPLCIPLSPFSG